MPWINKDVQLVLPTANVLAMFRRAEQYDVDNGGRFDRRGAAILVWSEPLRHAEPQAEMYFAWRTPDTDQSTLYTIGWDPQKGGSEDVVWEALEVLAGRSVRPG